MSCSSTLQALALLLGASTALAQSTEGSFAGIILDAQQKPVPAAAVRATNTSTGLTRFTRANHQGYYIIPLLPIGRYTLDAEAPGLERKTVTGLQVEIDRTLRVDFELQPATVRESVQVTAAPPLIDTESGAQGTIIENRRIVDLPLNGRQFLELAKLTPGVVQNAGGSLRAELTGNLAGPNITVYGARESDNYYSIDGISANDRFYNSPTVLPSVDAVAEFKVMSSAYAAEAGGQGGANINISIKSGGSQLHGSIYHFNRNSAFDTRNAFDLLDRTGDGRADIPQFQQNQFGATLGGPLRKSRTFYFAGYEGLRVRKSITQLQTVPTLAMRGGDFRELRGAGLAGRVIDPLTNQEFSTPNVIPPARLDRVATAMLRFVPEPNRPGISQNYVAQPKERNTGDQGVFRIDQNYSEIDRVFARGLISQSEGYLPFGTRSVLGTVRSAVPGFGNLLSLNSRNLALGWTRVFSPGAVGELRLGLNRVTGGQLPGNAGTDFTTTAGIRGLPPLPPNHRGFPRFSVAGYPEFGDIEFTIDRNNTEYSADYNLTWIRRNHTYKAGGMYRRVHFAPRSYQIPRGQYQFGGATTGAFSGAALADFLLGHPDTFNLADIDDAYLMGNEYSGYAQTDWRASRRLTLNLGIRYEFFGSLYDRFDRLSTFDITRRAFIVSSHNGQVAAPSNISNTPGFGASQISVTNPAGTFRFPIITTEQAGLPRGIIRNDRNNWAPRFGFAFDPTGRGRAAIRGAYGIFYSRPMYSTRQQLALQPPYSNRFQKVFGNAGTAANPTSIATAGAEFPAPTLLNASQFPDTNFPAGYVQQWNFTLETTAASDWKLSLAYVGSKGTRLYSNRLWNFPLPGAQPGGAVPANRGPNTSIGIFQNGQWIGGPPPQLAVQGPAFLRFNTLPEAPGMFFAFLMNTSGFSNYHAGTLRAERRYGGGLTVDASLTWSKSLDNDSLGIPVADSSATDQNPFDKSIEKARSSYDIRQRAVASFAWDIPFGRGLLGGWQAGGIATFESGLPFSVNLNGDYYGIGSSRRGRTDLAGDPNDGPRATTQWFNTRAFVLPPVEVTTFPFLFVPGPDFVRRMPTPLGRFGQAGRNIVDSDGVGTINFSMLKNFRITERTRIQFRTEIFNLLNHAEWGFPNREFLVPGAATILNPNWDRRTLNPDFGKIGQTRIDSRQIQFALKLLF
ncbi:MAG: carboxypeptidase regulatory-like domain-containing protein [Acidobacteria bacterium]|nr:carboxypeptidase regulatory-like domain-containing protein [Acidobacteriota bacterium]